MEEIDVGGARRLRNATILSESIRYDSGNGDSVDAYFSRPLGIGPIPSILIIHHSPGIDEWTREVVRKFADHSYLTICPNLLSREMETRTRDEAQAVVRSEGGVPDERMLADVQGGIRFLKNHLDSSGKLGIVGFCSGGRQAYLAACRLGANAIIDCYGGSIVADASKLSERHPIAPIDLTSDLNCPFLGLFGDKDPHVPIEDIHKLEVALKENEKSYETYVYPGAGHAFFCTTGKSYDFAAAGDGWSRIFEFLENNLKDQPLR